VNPPAWDELFSAVGRAPDDDAAWSSLYQALWPYLVDWAMSRYRLDADRAADALQDAFLQYRAKLRAGRIERPSLAHLRAFLRFCILTGLSEARRFVALDEVAPVAAASDPEAGIMRTLLVDHALDRLDHRCAYVLRARYFFGETTAEIAAALNLQPGTVDVLLHRCRAKCREALTELVARLR
jgi:RNA polymerase sigma factor (sigma-70 family)